MLGQKNKISGARARELHMISARLQPTSSSPAKAGLRRWFLQYRGDPASDRASHQARRPLHQAGWHMLRSRRSCDPALPPKSPELNPMENVWQFMATTGSPTEFSNPTRICSCIAVMPGTSSSINRGSLCHRPPCLGPSVLINGTRRHGRAGCLHRLHMLVDAKALAADHL